MMLITKLTTIFVDLRKKEDHGASTRTQRFDLRDPIKDSTGLLALKMLERFSQSRGDIEFFSFFVANRETRRSPSPLKSHDCDRSWHTS
ncbi:hypothetical protein ElyMa_002599400 [Elysia marginata]|uniref:Uncharacterized protein n=1 Tax=Elysia marginata TaxID=1093978 RepID=A0AAV4H549_9GAST|nr:hypothetical protein ElyMa_002599400 [Elysia marginata]